MITVIHRIRAIRIGAMARQALWYLLPALLVIFAVGSTHYYAVRDAERKSLLTTERLNVALGNATIVRALENVRADLGRLAEDNAARDLFRADDVAAKQALRENFLAFVAEKKRYDQVRFFDLAGNEQVRVNFAAGHPASVPERGLQNKSGRYYVEDASKLERGQIYVSSFDLDVEHGTLELPIKPVIRFGTPVFDATGAKTGFLFLNYLGEKLLGRFLAATANASHHIMLVNADGFWLASPRPGDAWGFIRGQAHGFGAEYPSAWAQMRDQSTGQIEISGDTFTFTTIEFGVKSDRGASGTAASNRAARQWKIIAHVPAERFGVGPGSYLSRHLSLYLAILAVLAAACALLGHATVRWRLAETQLEFEQRFRAIFNEVQLAVIGLDRTARIAFCNDALLELVGWKREQLVGRNWLETLVAPECHAQYEAMFARLSADETLPDRHESWLTTHGGERRLVAWNGVPITGQSDTSAGVAFLGEDVTAAREAEQELTRLSRAVEQSPSTVMITDTEGLIVYVNPKFTTLTGYRFDEVRGMNPRVLKSGSTPQVEYTELWKTIAAGGEWRGVFQNHKKNGELYWESATISAIRNDDGVIVSYLAVKEDITERRLLEERFRQCVEFAPSALVLCDHTGKVVLVNREAERMFGYEREGLLGEPVEMLVPAAIRHAHVRKREEFLGHKHSRAMGAGRDLFGQHKDGHLFPIEVGLHIIESDEGRMVLAAVVDITARRRLEEELNERTREIVRTQALAAVGRMANMVAHDLRNPLSSIKMGLQIIGKNASGRWTDEEFELREIALEQVRYMEDVFDDMLSYSRESSLSLEWLQVDKLLDAAILLVQKYVNEHGVQIKTRYQAGLPTLHGDAARLQRAFSNLILNGIQATVGIEGRRPELAVSTHLELAPDRPKIRVDIRDNGCGLDAEQRAKAFEPFFTTRAMGTGLGLAIVKRIVEEHGGTITLLAGEISGTCARIVLPTIVLERAPPCGAGSSADVVALDATGDSESSIQTEAATGVNNADFGDTDAIDTGAMASGIHDREDNR